MSGFLRRLVRKLPVGGPPGRRVTLGAFGKHPAWNDHIDPDINLGGCLPAIKQSLYLDGVRDRAIPTWGKATPEQLVSFHHLLVWRSEGDQYVAARMWHSQDGRGREDFPMVACVSSEGLPLQWVLEVAVPELEVLEERIRAATTREEVISIVEAANAELRSRVDETPTDPIEPSAQEALANIAAEPPVGLGRERLARVYHPLEDSIGHDRKGVHAEQVRVPRLAPSASAAVLLWSCALRAILPNASKALFMAPLDEGWIDIIIGDPDPSQFFVLRASLRLIPFTSDIGYTVNPALAAQIERTVAHLPPTRFMQADAAAVPPPLPPVMPPPLPSASAAISAQPNQP